MFSTQIIGGMFGLEAPSPDLLAANPSQPTFLKERHILLATARAAFTALNRHLRPTTVWLPSFLCHVIVEAFREDGTSVRFYEVGLQLEIQDCNWLAEVKAGDLIVFIDYFGFNHWSQIGHEARKRGAWVIEDASQAMLSDAFCHESHYVILSPRKFVGIPDGGILLAHAEATLPDLQLEPPPENWLNDAVTASRLRAEFDRHGGDRAWFPLFQKLEPLGPLEPFRMSELSSNLLAHGIHWPGVARQRRENYKTLANALNQIALMPDLPDGVVPLGFPVRIKNRDHTRHLLFSHEIYPPVHWPIAPFVPPKFVASHQLAREIMTLPCDQRYKTADMDRIISVLYAK